MSRFTILTLLVLICLAGVVAWRLRQETPLLEKVSTGPAAPSDTSASEAFASTISQLPADPEEADIALREALGEWAMTQPEQARDWLEAHAEADSERQAMRQAAVVISWAEGNSPAAAAYALEKIPDSLPRNHALVAVVQRWAQQDGTAAAAFVMKLPSSPVQVNAATELVAVWAEADTQPPAQWIERLPASPLKDACIDRLARELAAEAPEAARAWAKRVQDPTRRAQCLQSIDDLQPEQ